MSAPTTVERRARPSGRAPVPTLRILWSGERDGRLRVLRSGELAVGREPEGERVLELADDPLLSRTHAVLTRRGDQVRVTDRGSRNGSWLNGERLLPDTPTPLVDGAVLRLGDSLFLYRLEPSGVEDAAVDGLVGVSPAIRALRADLARIGPTPASVVLLGASGTGKGVAARALHELSARAGRFVSVNCAAIPAQLAESQLFGHKAGAFTGASAAAPGVFRDADGGSLFLDEIGDLPLPLQPKLLHAVEEGGVVPVGASRPVSVDVRLVVATSVDLEQAVTDGRFRGDLYTRLAELVLRLPPLAERAEDVLPLLAHFAPELPPLTPDLAEALVLHGWPFNVRELNKVATELRIRGAGRAELDVDLVRDRLDLAPPIANVSAEAAGDSTQEPRRGPPDRAELERLLAEHGGVVADVARATGRSRKQVYRWLRDHGLDPSAWR